MRLRLSSASMEVQELDPVVSKKKTGMGSDAAPRNILSESKKKFRQPLWKRVTARVESDVLQPLVVSSSE
jgi:hypothetical protein